MPELIRTIRNFTGGQPEAYLGNGFIGYRIAPNPFLSWKAAVSGFVRKHKDGRFEALAYAPYPFWMDMRLNGGASILQSQENVKVIEQSLDMSCGELTTEMEVSVNGLPARVSVLQFLSRSHPAISCQEIKIRMPAGGRVDITSAIIGGPGTVPYAFTPPGHENVVDLLLGFSSHGYLSRCGTSIKVNICAPNVVRDELERKDQTSRTHHLKVQEGQELIIRTLAATISSLYHPEPDLESCRLVNWGDSVGFQRLRELNRKAWVQIWRSRVKVTGDSDWPQKYLDNSIFYIYSSAHSSSLTSIAPFGLSQAENHYHGHVFWDADAYIMPALLLGSPDTAKMVVDYRRRCLDAAIKRASYYGYKGAMYPWESDTRGYESTPSRSDTGWLEHHVNLCVAAGAWWYQKAAGDAVYARESTWPILKSVAEWIVSRVEETKRGFEIRNIMGSNEGEPVDNNSYVNALAAQVLRDAYECAGIVGCHPSEGWAKVAEAMYIPISQLEGACGIAEDILFDDTLYMGFPFDLPLSREIYERIFEHHRTDNPGDVAMGFAFYVSAAAFVGRRKDARLAFDHASKSMSEPVWGMGTEYTGAESTCFLTTMGGLLQTVMMAFTGLRFEPGNWAKYDACLPQGWEKIEIERIFLGRKPYRLEAVHGKRAILEPLIE